MYKYRTIVIVRITPAPRTCPTLPETVTARVTIGKRLDRISNKPVKRSFWQTDEDVFLLTETSVHAYKKYGLKRSFSLLADFQGF